MVIINNDFHETVQVLFELIWTENAGGVQIDPLLFERYDISAVPALVVTCEAGYDRLTGNLRIKEALARIAEEGECRDVARQFLAGIREVK
ncbi:TPA: type-F conjugative transfer system pilin assembly protein TrbC [Enterobacter cancerogenus]